MDSNGLTVGIAGVRAQAVRDTMGPHDPPSTLLGVAALGYADQLVELDAVAAITIDQ